MELNINSPAFFSEHYGIDDDVYRYCQSCYEFFKEKEYSETLTIIGICPCVAPNELYKQGKWKEKVQLIGNSSCAIISIRLDFDQYYNATGEERIILVKDAILRAVKKVKSKENFDYESFRRDLDSINNKGS